MPISARDAFNLYSDKAGLAFRTSLVEARPVKAGDVVVLSAPPKYRMPMVARIDQDGWQMTYLDGWPADCFDRQAFMPDEKFNAHFRLRQPGFQEALYPNFRADFIRAGTRYSTPAGLDVATEDGVLMTNKNTGNSGFFSVARYHTYFNTPVCGLDGSAAVVSKIYELKPDPEREPPQDYVVVEDDLLINPVQLHHRPIMARPGDRIGRMKMSSAENYAVYPEGYFDKIFIVASPALA